MVMSFLNNLNLHTLEDRLSHNNSSKQLSQFERKFSRKSNMKYFDRLITSRVIIYSTSVVVIGQDSRVVLQQFRFRFSWWVLFFSFFLVYSHVYRVFHHHLDKTIWTCEWHRQNHCFPMTIIWSNFLTRFD